MTGQNDRYPYPTRGEVAAGYQAVWTPRTFFAAGAVVVNPAGALVRRTTDGTSGDSYDPAAWTPAGSAGDTAWTNVLPASDTSGAAKFNTGYANLGSGYAPAGFRKDANGVVRLRGLVTMPSASGTIFTLPSGYRPGASELLPTVSNSAFAVLGVNTDGTVTASGGSTAWFTIACTFMAV